MLSYTQMEQHQVQTPSRAFQGHAAFGQNATSEKVCFLTGACLSNNPGPGTLDRTNVNYNNGSYFNQQMSNWGPVGQNGSKPDYKCLKMAGDYTKRLQRGLEPPKAKTKFQICQPTNVYRLTNHVNQNIINSNSTYHQEKMPVYWNSSNAVNGFQTTIGQARQGMSNSQPNMVHQGLHQIVNGGLTRGASAYSQAPTSFIQEQAVFVHALTPAAIHNSQSVLTAHNEVPRQMENDCRFSSSYLASQGMTISQSSGINSMSTQFINTQRCYASSTNQNIQQQIIQTALQMQSSANLNNVDQSLARSSTSKLPPYPNATMQQTPRPGVIMDSLLMSNTTGSGGHHAPPPPYSMASCMKMQTMTAHPLTNDFNINVSQSSALNSGQSMPQSNDQRLQHNGNGQHLQNSSLDASTATPGENNSENGVTNRAHFLNDSAASSESPARLLNNVPQLINKPEGESPKKTTETFLTKYPHLVEILLPSTPQKDCASPSTPCHIGTRVVAVVQPLSQEETETTSSNGPNCELQTDMDKNLISPSMEKNKVVTCEVEQSDAFKGIQNELTVIKARSDESTTSDLLDSEYHSFASAAEPEYESRDVSQNTSEETGSQSCPQEELKAKGEQTKDPITNSISLTTFPDLSSVPTISWTAKALKDFKLDINDGQEKQKDISVQPPSLKDLFWKEDDLGVYGFEDVWVNSLTLEAEKFCELHVGEDTVVLSQVKEDQFKHYHVLKDDEVFSEPPYKSSWLNINDKLDDIDKEFGFSWNFKYCHCLLRDGSKSDNVQISNGGPEQSGNEEPDQQLTESGSTDVDKVGKGSFDATPSQINSPSKSDRDVSGDVSPYSFKLEVLAPEKAKLVHEQGEKMQSFEFQALIETVQNNPQQEQIPKESDPPPKESVEFINSTEDEINQYCCFAKFKEVKFGSNDTFPKCQCDEDQRDCVDLHDAESPDSDILILSGHELCSKSIEIIDLTDCGKLDSPGQKTEIISHQRNTCLSYVWISEDDEDDDDDFSDIQPVLQTEMTNPTLSVDVDEPTEVMDVDKATKVMDVDKPTEAVEMDESGDKFTESVEVYTLKELNSTETVQLSASVDTFRQMDTLQLPNTEEGLCLQMSDHNEDCEEVESQLAELAKSPLKSKGETQINCEANGQTSSKCPLQNETCVSKWKRQHSVDDNSSFLKESKKCKVTHELDQLNVCSVKPSVRKLVLFGSEKVGKDASNGNSYSHIYASEKMSYEKDKPPRVLSVKKDISDKNSVEVPQKPIYSVKREIFKRWKNSLPDASQVVEKSSKKNQKDLRSYFSSPSQRNLQQKKKKLSKKRKYSPEEEKRRPKRALSVDSSIEAKKRYIVQPAVKRSNCENECQNAKDNLVLKFRVLPKSFKLMDGPSMENENTHSVPDEAKLSEEKDSTSNTAPEPKGSWYRSPPKLYKPICVPKNVNLFNEYKKLYNGKNQASREQAD